MKRILISVCLLSAVILAGCVSDRSYKQEFQYTQNWGKEFFKLKDPKLYKSKLEEEIHYFLYPEYSMKNQDRIVLKAGTLKMAYLRLFVIEDALGNQAEADNCLRKARYWYMIMLEHDWNNNSPKYINETIRGVTKENARQWIKKLSPGFVKKVEAMAKAEKADGS